MYLSQLTNVVVDEPLNVPGSIPAVWSVTNPELAIVRMHGRNHEMWNAKGLKSSAERFDYDYTNDELQEFVEPIKKLAREVKRLHVVMNNNRDDQAIRNGRTLRTLLGAH
jgi:uncharacterized protein YecE (DUF72 family)